MPNIKSAKKRVLVAEKKAAANKAVKTQMKTQIKKFLAAVEAGDEENASKVYSETVSVIDSTASKGVIIKTAQTTRNRSLRRSLKRWRNRKPFRF